ncbi:hypothetical protein [Prauserella muralis]|uniref:Uncharacterized protein n=1 Tax=Prauserella muralis TaxID=588067 RepID=A0A2V4B0H9_9PSEU|nr:hypothetical protein [Prauserella muralis]PXY27761.1 hypothetical protein BAY60_15390 [Prauserella muralis]PXY33451.1 hypothetical protein BAY59_10195 [Prauserella coralliicola]TWE22484.1 hypothetical protein FHX69_3725 [Prauserella muralis]
MTIDLTPEQVLAAAGALFALVLVWRMGTRRARKAAEVARASARVVSLAGRVVFMAAAFVGVQWLVIANPGNTTLLIVVLALPDLLAAYVLTRTLTVTSMDTTKRRGDRR